jgi:hypothetical protein
MKYRYYNLKSVPLSDRDFDGNGIEHLSSLATGAHKGVKKRQGLNTV